MAKERGNGPSQKRKMPQNPLSSLSKRRTGAKKRGKSGMQMAGAVRIRGNRG